MTPEAFLIAAIADAQARRGATPPAAAAKPAPAKSGGGYVVGGQEVWSKDNPKEIKNLEKLEGFTRYRALMGALSQSISAQRGK